MTWTEDLQKFVVLPETEPTQNALLPGARLPVLNDAEMYTEEHFISQKLPLAKRFPKVSITIRWPRTVDCEGLIACLHLFRDCFVDSDVKMRFSKHQDIHWPSRTPLLTIWTPYERDNLDGTDVPDSELVLNHLMNFRCRKLQIHKPPEFDEALTTQVIQAAQSKIPATSLFADLCFTWRDAERRLERNQQPRL